MDERPVPEYQKDDRLAPGDQDFQMFAAAARQSIRVLVLDATRIASQSLAAALKNEHIEIVYAGADAQEAVSAAKRDADVAVVSANVDHKVGSGYESAAQIHRSSPTVQIILLVENADRESVVQAFRSGARGVFGRDNSVQELQKAIGRVHQGQVWASSDQLRHLLEALTSPPRTRVINAHGASLLAPREQEVVYWISEGLTNREIADQLGISENTVKNYIFRIFDKLGISKRVELVLYAASQYSGSAAVPRGTTASEGTFVGDNSLAQWCHEVTERFAANQHFAADASPDANSALADPVTSLTWFLIGEKMSTEFLSKSQRGRQQLEKRLTPEQVAAARKHAADWLARHKGANAEEQPEVLPAA